MNPADVASMLAAGRGREALELARQGAAANPRDAHWHHLLGAAMHANGASADAIDPLRRAVELSPADAVLWNTLGAVQVEAARFDDAEEALRKAVQLDPGYVEARFNLASCLRRAKRYAEARTILESLRASRPEFAAADLELGLVLIESGDAPAAIPVLDSLASRFPAEALVAATLANALQRSGRNDEAVAAAQRAAKVGAASGKISEAAADVLARAGRSAEARDLYASLAAKRPGELSIVEKLGMASFAAGDAEEAIAILGRAVSRGSVNGKVLSALAMAKCQAWDWSGLDELAATIKRQAASTPVPTQASLYLEGVSASEQRVWAQHWAARFPVLPALAASKPRDQSRRVRIGYLSSDFNGHATAQLIAGFIESHDRARFETFAYSTGADDGTALAQRVRRAFEHFVELGDAPALAAARRIANDGIDVLVDMGGYVKGSRLDILAHRPAAIQGHFLGYPATTGAPFVDFFVADRFVVPPGREGDFTEKILRMPHCYQPNDPKRSLPEPAPRRALGLPESALVFCSLNAPYKIQPNTFRRWCALLAAVPGSVLWLLGAGASAEARLGAFARREGVDPARLVFAGRASHDEHMARLRASDIAIDTFPCVSHTTASDVVWAGVPLVTTHGETFVSRVAASVLHAAGCGDWAFDDADRAFEATLALARDARLRQDARARLVAARSSPLFDAAAFARDFESLILQAIDK